MKIERRSIMKALRYLLIVMGLMSVLSISAQALAQKPEAQMQSTSVMVSTGSTLPSAAAAGAVVTGSTPGTYSPASVAGPRRSKKEDVNPSGGFNPGGGEPGPDEGDNSEPWADPIGDAAWPLMLLAGVYLIVRGARKRSRALRWSRSDVK